MYVPKHFSEAEDQKIRNLVTENSFVAEPGAWEFELPEDLLDVDSLTSAIISFKFHIEKKEAKFKLSQNRPEVDRHGVVAGLKQRSDENSKAILKMM